MVTLGRSDALLAAQIIACYIEENKTHLDEFGDEEPKNLLEFILVQLHSMAEEKEEVV